MAHYIHISRWKICTEDQGTAQLQRRISCVREIYNDASLIPSSNFWSTALSFCQQNNETLDNLRAFSSWLAIVLVFPVQHQEDLSISLHGGNRDLKFLTRANGSLVTREFKYSRGTSTVSYSSLKGFKDLTNIYFLIIVYKIQSSEL